MLVDLEDFGEPFTQPRSASVCIAGGGIAGLVLATALADAGIDVHLLEAGGHTLEDRSQKIYEAEMSRTRHEGATLGRFRVFGGSSTRWGGQILPYTPEVFSPGPELPSSSWPITADALAQFYRRIEEVLGTDHLPFTTELCEALGIALPAEIAHNPGINLRFSKWAPFSRRNVAQTLGKRAIASKRITVFLHANVTECLLSPGGSRVEAFLVRNYRGYHFRFEARQHVLAVGTIEGIRLLLASRTVHQCGVGNMYHQVGRCLHDHVSASVAELRGYAREQLPKWLGPFYAGSTRHTGRLEASASLRRRLGLLAVMAHVSIEEPQDSGAFLTRHLFRSMQRGLLSSALIASLPRLPAASFEIFRIAYYAKIQKCRPISAGAVATLHIDSEQRIDPQNHIRLDENGRDALNLPKTIIDWHVSTDELDTIRKYTEWLRGEFDRVGLTGIEWLPGYSDGNTGTGWPIRDTNHLMGGTIMGNDRKQSVVDTNLRVHDVENLFIASLSTFPAGGTSNPTFTLIALALRLAEHLTHLARQLSTGYSSVSNAIRI